MPPSMVVRIAGNAADLRKELLDTEKSIQATSAQVQKLANSFNGDRMITHAHNVTAAIKEVGVTTLTASQASRNLDLLERAMDKMRRTAEPIPENMKRTAEQLKFMARSTDEAIPKGQQITQVYQKFDGVLQSLGINIGPYVKGLQDVTNAYSGVQTAATGAATGVGLLAAAAAVVATAIGSWKLGEHIAQTYELHDSIAEGWAVMLGYGDRAQQVAQAFADMGDAQLHFMQMQRLQQETTRADTEAKRAHSDAIKENWRITEGNTDAFRQLSQQLDAAKAKKLADAKASTDAAHAQWLMGDATEQATTKVQEQTAALDERIESVKRIMQVEAERKAQQDAFMNAPTLNDREASSYSTDVGPLTGNALQDVINRYRLAGETDPNQALRRALDQLSALEGTYKPTDNLSFFEMQKNQVLLAQLRQMFGVGNQAYFTGRYANGGRDIPGGMAWVGELGPELVNLPGGSDVIPNHALGGVTIAPQLHFHGPVIGTSFEFEQMVTAALMNIVRSGAEPLPVWGFN